MVAAQASLSSAEIQRAGQPLRTAAATLGPGLALVKAGAPAPLDVIGPEVGSVWSRRPVEETKKVREMDHLTAFVPHAAGPSKPANDLFVSRLHTFHMQGGTGASGRLKVPTFCGGVLDLQKLLRQVLERRGGLR